MGKRRLSLKVRIPEYQNPRNKWRHQIYKNIRTEIARKHVSYLASDRLELRIVLYLKKSAILFHDVDNRLKDIMDALQGRAGGTKQKPTLKPIIQNDNMIFRVTMEKKIPPKQSLGLGHLVVKKLIE